MLSSRSIIAGLAVALLAPGPETLSPHEAAQDLQSLVGRNWNTVRPARCQGESLLRTTEPLRTYVIPSWRGRTLFVYRAGGPIFEVMHTEHDRQVNA